MVDIASPTDFDFTFSSPSENYCEFDELLIAANTNRSNCLATVPFAWEDKPGVPKTPTKSLQNDDFDDFSFDVSCRFDTESIPKVYPFNGRLIKTVDPPVHVEDRKLERERGRERGNSISTSSRSRRTRSLSPIGSSDQWRQRSQIAPMSPPPSSETGSRRWRFLDLFLPRSVSDGRATNTDPLKKFQKYDEDIRNSGSVSNRRNRVTVHELHYRAVSNDMKKKTYLPYKQGIIG